MIRRRVAIHLHVFYPEMLEELVACIRNIETVCGEGRVDVVTTCPVGRNDIRGRIGDLLPAAQLVEVPNAGYDVGPFFEFLNRINLDDYDYVVKLHTKRDKPLDWVNFRRFRGGEWRRALLSFCSTIEAVRWSLRAFERDPRLGVVADRRVMDPSGIAQGDFGWQEVGALRRLGFHPARHTFVYGTMFMMRASLLKAVQHKVHISDFSMVDRPHVDYGLALEWEMALPVLAEVQGFYVSDGKIPAALIRPYLLLLKIKFTFLRRSIDLVRNLFGADRLMRVYQVLRMR